jgi:hypothetical protein
MMPLVPLAYGLLACAGWMFGIAAYQLAHALTGRLFGLQVEVVSVGFGPTIVSRRFANWEFRIALLIWGGYTTYQGGVPEEDADLCLDDASILRFLDLAPLKRVAIALSGPLTSLLLGLLLVSVPIVATAPQLAVVPQPQSMVSPCAVEGLALMDRPSDWEGQQRLFADTAFELTHRAVAFQSLEGWGSFIGFMVTAGLVGDDSAWAWLSCLGTLFLWNGLFNLLPIPPMNGATTSWAIYGLLAESCRRTCG